MMNAVESAIDNSVKIRYAHNERGFLFRETSPDTKLPGVLILTDEPRDTLAIRIDTPSILRFSEFFRRGCPSINKRSDGLVLCRKNGRLFAVILEMKSERVNDYKLQLENTAIFTEFLLRLVGASNPAFTSDNIEWRRVLFTTRSSKAPTSATYAKRHRIPDSTIQEIACRSNQIRTVALNQILGI